MTINKQALREAAEKATSGKWERGDGNGNGGELLVYSDDALGSAVCEMTSEYNAIPKYQRINNLNFISAANPATVLALLDELDAAAKSNAFLKGQLAELANFNHDWDKLEASYESWRKIAAELLVVKLEALAGMAQEPYGYVHKEVYESEGSCGLSSDHEAHRDSRTHIPLYAAPQLPQQAMVAPDEMTPKQASRSYCGEVRGYRDGCNACRDAMLQGAEPVTTAYKFPFEQWLSQQTGTIDVDCGCVTTEAFYHWLRVAYEAGNSPATPDGWQLVPKVVTPEIGNAINEVGRRCTCGNCSQRLWDLLIAAAPQQEVN